ncbi:MAG: histidine kinase [Rhizobacter sp.]|nr:histidine kinase [Rhizobacter sp.]
MSLPSSARARLLDLLRNGLIVVAFNTVLGLGLALRNDNAVNQMIYTQAIGLSIWLSVDLGRYLFKRAPESNWPFGWRTWLLLGVAIPFGYVVGTLIGDAYCQCSKWDQLQHSPRMFVAYLFLSVMASGGITYFFYTRGRGRALEELVATAQRDAAETQLKLLASQLEPHMLFNTLANLRVLIGLDPERAQSMLDHLVAFMRATLSASRNMLHPLSAEFARIADYLELMKIRMGERLQTRLDLPDDLGALAVPTLVLQPLVENAIKHGLEPKVDGGRLEVAARRDGHDLVLTVRDTGVGVSDVANDGTHFGVAQVRERLSTLYGDAASFTLGAPADGEGGVLATLRIPLNRTT